MVNIRNFQGKNLFLKIFFRKALGYFTSLKVFHNHNYVSPRNISRTNSFFTVKPRRPSLKPVFKYLFSCLASVLILVANKQHLHKLANIFKNINLAIIFLLLTPLISAFAISPSTLEFANKPASISQKDFIIFNDADEEKSYELSLLGKDWFSFDPYFTIQKNQNKKLSIKLRIPKDTGDGVYFSKLYIKEVNHDKDKIAISKALILKLKVDVDSDFEDFDIVEDDFQPLPLMAQVQENKSVETIKEPALSLFSFVRPEIALFILFAILLVLLSFFNMITALKN